MDRTMGTVPLWGRWEATFEAEGEPPPGTEITAVLTSPSGVEKRAAGFWDGGCIWKVRFMPEEEGEWQVRTVATGEYAGLHNQRESFSCVKDAGDNPLLIHGPVRVAANGHYLEHADGTPFFFLGDTTWNGPMLSRKEDWDVYLRDRRSKHFTGIQFVSCAPWVAAYSNREGEIAYTNLEHFPVNPHYFGRIDERMDAINDAGLIAVLVLLWEGPPRSMINPGKFLPEEQLLKVVRYQLARYGAHHLIWILMGDGRYEGEVADKWVRIGRAAYGDGPHAPVAIHPCGQHWPYDRFREESWMDIIGYQSGHNDRVGQCTWIHSGPASEEWKREPARPSIDLEPCYEDHTSHASQLKWMADRVRRNCYWTVLNAPPAGLTYGGHGIWSWQEVERTPLNHPRTGPAKPWRIAKDLPGTFDMKRLVECFTSIRWWELRPDRALVRLQPFADDETQFVSAARSEAGDLGMVYLPVGCEIQLDVDRLDPKIAARWFNPRTGETADAQVLEPGAYRAPDDGDWVLILACER